MESLSTKVTLVQCTTHDIFTLAEMNLKLIEDEGSENEMNLQQLAVRMDEFLKSGYNGYIFMLQNSVVGYALVRMTSMPYYIRHFYVCREYRRVGCGTLAFKALRSGLGTDIFELEVLHGNNRGRKFWESLGFFPHSLYMRFDDRKGVHERG